MVDVSTAWLNIMKRAVCGIWQASGDVAARWSAVALQRAGRLIRYLLILFVTASGRIRYYQTVGCAPATTAFGSLGTLVLHT